MAARTDDEQKLPRLRFQNKRTGAMEDYIPPSNKEELAYYMKLLFGITVAKTAV